jgi:hypothetical protein
MTERRTFVDRVLAGEIHDPDDAIHTEIDCLSIEHDSGPGPWPPTHELLGLTLKEWRTWLYHDFTITEVLAETRGYKHEQR